MWPSQFTSSVLGMYRSTEQTEAHRMMKRKMEEIEQEMPELDRTGLAIEALKRLRCDVEEETTNDDSNENDYTCVVCKSGDEQDENQILICDGCEDAYHQACVTPPIETIPEGDWFCEVCHTKRPITEMYALCETILQFPVGNAISKSHDESKMALITKRIFSKLPDVESNEEMSTADMITSIKHSLNEEGIVEEIDLMIRGQDQDAEEYFLSLIHI